MSVSSQARILALRRLLAKHPSTNVFQKQVQQIRYNVLGQLPQLNMRTGHQKSKRQLKGVYYTQYYLDSMEQAARKAIPGYQSEYEERKAEKLFLMKRRGKGPPKKGAGSRATRK